MNEVSKEFLKMIHNLLVDGVNFGTATESMRRADQIEDICKGFCEYVEELEENFWRVR